MTADRRELTTWQRIRRYAVPARMVEECTERRLAGDWRGACAAAGVDIAPALDELLAGGGRGASQIAADLTEFAPDLLRWHLPRALGGRTTLSTRHSCLLSGAAGPLGRGTPVLAVRLPKTVDGSQRLRLDIAEPDPTRWRSYDGWVRDLPPYLWRADRAGELRDAFPDLAEPPPAGLLVEWLMAAWRAAGVELSPPGPPTRDWETDPGEDLMAMPDRLGGLLAEAVRLADRYRVDEVALDVTWPRRVVLDLTDRSRPRAVVADYPVARTAPSLRHRLPDLALLRAGLVTPTELHPLVRAALCPEFSVTDPPPAVGALPGGEAPLPFGVRVRCRGEWHRLEHRGGALHVVSHSAEEERREEALRSLGGLVHGCFAVRQAWHTGTGRLPKTLRAHRQDLLERIRHGGGVALDRLLDAGLDPHLRDGRGGSLLHQLRATGPGPLPRLLATGLPVDTRDHRGRTPLHVAVGDGGDLALVSALLRAGADPGAEQLEGSPLGGTVLDLSGWKSRDDRSGWYGYDKEYDESMVEPPGNEMRRINRLLTGWADRGRV